MSELILSPEEENKSIVECSDETIANMVKHIELTVLNQLPDFDKLTLTWAQQTLIMMCLLANVSDYYAKLDYSHLKLGASEWEISVKRINNLEGNQEANQ